MKGREFKRVWGQPWDYGYLLDIEKRKLKEMANYFKKSQIVLGWERQVKQCELCVKLIDIIQERDKDYAAYMKASYNKNTGFKPTKFHKYVNTQNIKRFFPKINLNRIEPCTWNHLSISLRIEKAWHLYHKIRVLHMREWWD